MIVRYSSNNSGGDWWLSDEDWKKLEDAGWKVNWVENDPDRFYLKNSRFLGALATDATIEAPSIWVAKALWEATLNMDPDEEGCSCCGQPHNFYDFD